MPFLTLSLSRAIVAQLDRLARQHHTSRNAIILRATRALIQALSQEKQR